MAATSIKVPTEVRDRLADRAQRDHTTLAGALENLLDTVEEAEFWAQVRATMRPDALARDAAAFDSTLRDGAQPDEQWSDLL